MRAPARLTAPFALSLAALGACSTDPARPPAGPTVEAVAGVYTLRTIDGRPLPGRTYSSGGRSEDTEREVRTLSPDRTCTIDRAFRGVTYNFTVSLEGRPYSGTSQTPCTWVLEGTTVTFLHASGATYDTAGVTGPGELARTGQYAVRWVFTR
jgi:hypothetical protein